MSEDKVIIFNEKRFMEAMRNLGIEVSVETGKIFGGRTLTLSKIPNKGFDKAAIDCYRHDGMLE